MANDRRDPEPRFDENFAERVYALREIDVGLEGILDGIGPWLESEDASRSCKQQGEELSAAISRARAARKTGEAWIAERAFRRARGLANSLRLAMNRQREAEALRERSKLGGLARGKATSGVRELLRDAAEAYSRKNPWIKAVGAVAAAIAEDDDVREQLKKLGKRPLKPGTIHKHLKAARWSTSSTRRPDSAK